MRDPIDVPGFTLQVKYPASIYSLERHEIIPYERFASNVFRDCVQELKERHLPLNVIVSFAPEESTSPAWAINCSVSTKSALSSEFNIETPEMLPCILMVFSHFISPHFRSSCTSQVVSELSEDIQRFFDCCSAGAIAYKRNGLASAIRTTYKSASLDFASVQKCMDDYDILSYLISNHEVAHIYIEQFKERGCSPRDKKAYEYLADLVSAEWMFRRYIYFTPDDTWYREQRGLPSHSHALLANSKWALSGIFNLLVLMAAAGAQRCRGRINFDGGVSHPGGFGRSWLKQSWVIGAIEGEFKTAIGDELWPHINSFWEESIKKVFDSGLVSRDSMWQVVDENEVETISRAVQIADEKKIEEISHGLDFLRSRADTARGMRNKMK